MSVISSKGHKPKNMNIFLTSPTGFYTHKLKREVCLLISYLIIFTYAINSVTEIMQNRNRHC